MPHELSFLGTIDDNFSYTATSAVDTTSGMLRGRPHGGVALLWRKSIFPNVTVIQCKSVRLSAIKVSTATSRSFIVFSVYMPVDVTENLAEFTSCLGEISAIIESCDLESIYIMGDFNAHPSEAFGKELINFCSEQKWICVDLERLGITSDTYTYISDSHGSRRWLDHCLVTENAWSTVTNINVKYDVYWSDHFPLILSCNINMISPKIVHSVRVPNKIVWGTRDTKQIEQYNKICNSLFRDLDYPTEFTGCDGKLCNNVDHKVIISNMYNNIVKILREWAVRSYILHKKKPRVIGWNKHVRSAHDQARIAYLTWIQCGKPTIGPIYNNMCETKRVFKSKIKWCQNNELQLQVDMLATHHKAKDFNSFWKLTNKLVPKNSLPVSMNGICDHKGISNLFKDQFMVQPQPCNIQGALSSKRPRADTVMSDMNTLVRAKDIVAIINGMKRGKSPGHDGLSIEHLRFAGKHLPRVLAMFYNFCISHSYLPDDLMKTVVVPIIKNKTGDASDGSNYRPISLATILAKVLDSLLDKQLNKHMSLSDAQFGFQSKLSTETAILCLKHTVQYYTSRKTPVYACFLDLSKAFDLVSYDRLWEKMLAETTVPEVTINLFRYWYSNQMNVVRWADSYSDEYRLDCGVRQGGITSPKLFNLYINGLIVELSKANVGCSINGNTTNNISYADDMVLLSPSISALNKLIRICEAYAAAHGLKYNIKKSELMLFKAGTKSYDVPPVLLNGSPLTWVKQFKYLGHWVVDSLSDDMDLERERRALSVRCNMLARRFARCSKPIKNTLFKAYCQSFYTCSLWVKYTQKAYSALRVQYNNGYRMLLGLPRFCSASGMFAEARIDDFFAIRRKRIASLLRRVRDGANSFLAVVSQDINNDIMRHWMAIQKPSILVFSVK
ncbi:uncharacterized protein LOC113505646 [Trichoplusia ni]|uniref:Uncharacterized protein LOC113505646 n=1 Tax=Trichoplusia ni TaxID=7111 RepID=A0A7E5WVR3_TRINI|nr:uncharacterized protein LOC113505646 [Trichoplusia ni]